MNLVLKNQVTFWIHEVEQERLIDSLIVISDSERGRTS